MYNFWPREGMRCNNRIITPKKSFDTLGAHMNSSTSILFNTPQKNYDEYEELILEEDEDVFEPKQENNLVPEQEIATKKHQEETESNRSNRFNQSCLP